MSSPYDDLDRPPLDASAVLDRLRADLWRRVLVRTATESTNADLAELARDDEPEGVVLVAEHQTGGRGRLGRVWVAPPRSGLTVSFLLRPAVPSAAWPWLPLLTGVAVVEALQRRTGVDATLKWPNDVVAGDRKLAGILLERVDTPGGPAAVVGLGLNVSLRADELPVPTATSLALEGAETTDRIVVLRELLRVLAPLYQAWVAARGDATQGLADAYQRRCATVGRNVRVDLPTGDAVHGRAVRVDPEGRLVVATTAGEVAVSAGDVVHVR